MSEQAVLTERRGGALVVMLNRPDRRNAINRTLNEQLTAAIREIDTDPQLRVGILASSTPGMFCAGADIQAMARGELRDLITFSQQPHAKPWIAACTGPVLGGGMEHALACEMIVAGEGATFGQPEVKRGLIAGGGGAFRLARAIPRAIALEMLLTGGSISAGRAYDLGLVNRVVPDSQVLDAAMDLAERLMAASPAAVRETLQIANGATDLSEDALWEATRGAQLRLREHPDSKEGMAAFLEKRKPQWAG